jgi:hypothetical protein
MQGLLSLQKLEVGKSVFRFYFGTSKSWKGCGFIKRKRKHCTVVQLAPVSDQLYSGVQYNSTELVARTGVNIANKLCDIVAHCSYRGKNY